MRERDRTAGAQTGPVLRIVGEHPPPPSVIEKIERGNKQSEAGKVISESDLDKEIDKWFK